MNSCQYPEQTRKKKKRKKERKKECAWMESTERGSRYPEARPKGDLPPLPSLDCHSPPPPFEEPSFSLDGNGYGDMGRLGSNFNVYHGSVQVPFIYRQESI